MVTAILLFLFLRQMGPALWPSVLVAAVLAILALTIGTYVRYGCRPWSVARYGLAVLLLASGLTCLSFVFLGRGLVDEAISQSQRRADNIRRDDAMAQSRKRADNIRRDDAMDHTTLGNSFHQEGRMDQAIAEYQKALEIDPNLADAHSNLGVAFLEMGRVKDSIAHLQKALEINPNYVDAHYNLGNSLLQGGRVEEALTHYNKVFEIDPNNVEARNNMAWVLATWPETRIRNGNKAVEVAERADALTNSVNPVISVTLAAAYAEAGRFPDALKTAERALKLATGQGNTALTNSIRAQIELYQSSSPLRAH